VIIGVPREIKDGERRVALTPTGATVPVQAGHTVLIETEAGEGSGFPDAEYNAAGAEIHPNAAAAWEADLVLKVKEPLPPEYDFLRPGLALFTYLHLAAEPALTERLGAGQVTAIAYETVQERDGRLPLLQPMSEIGGRLAPQVAAHHLTHLAGGSGKLLGGVPGVPPAQVTVLGAGTVGSHAVQIAVGLGAQVTVFNRSVDPLRRLDATFGSRIVTIAASAPAIAEAVESADVLIGAVPVTGARARCS
jgi:alanine dehydrogenase